eukprot:GDKH01015024.1.p1 GENE.GDKH01015024.1~~GDKH01015024.1.p1  ORF type:complete len:309 (-),score=37.73 GDKH01015024.1:204-1130(-)
MTDATRIGFRQKCGSQMDSVIRPVNGVREEMLRRGVNPKDFAKQNVSLLKQAQERNRHIRNLHEEQASQEPFVMSRFKTAKPLVYEQPRGVSTENARPFLKAHSGNVAGSVPIGKRASPAEAAGELPVSAIQSSAGAKLRPKPRPTVPRASEALPVTRQPNNKDYIRDNARRAVQLDSKPGDAPRVPARLQVAPPDRAELHPEFGRLPKYIEQFRSDETDKKLRAEAEAARRAIPDGYRVLGEAERLETLATLQKKREEVEKEAGRLPLRIETVGQKRRQAELQRRLDELDGAVKVFEKKTVLVELDS